ncbi:MAG: aromatic ring-hydroxylating dioxygenase subunit alpha, partial [Akkermansiaceae bacterium]|nr:aromatic ring-hydroxylating dioxygenase subunit alpha [Akkermansiaceae bacterium]
MLALLNLSKSHHRRHPHRQTLTHWVIGIVSLALLLFIWIVRRLFFCCARSRRALIRRRALPICIRGLPVCQHVAKVIITGDDVCGTCDVIVIRGADGTVRALSNVCRHRGNRLLWEGTPRGESCGQARHFVCKYHGWRYALDGACTYVHQESEFFDLRKEQLGLAPVRCATWAGFVFVNLDREPRWTLREYLGPMVGALEGYPFDRMTERYSFRAENASNWKVFIDAFQEYYHVPPLHTHQLGPTPEAQNPEYEFEAAHYQLDGPHRMVTTSGTHKHRWPLEHLYPSEALTRSGTTGPWDAPDLGEKLPGVNPSGIERWGIDNFQVFPNLEILIYERGWFVTYRYWPTSHNIHVFEGDLHFVPARSARERIAHEYAAITFKEYALQDAGTLDGTQMGLEQRAFREFHLNDQEILIRHFHKTVRDWVENHALEKAES